MQRAAVMTALLLAGCIPDTARPRDSAPPPRTAQRYPQQPYPDRQRPDPYDAPPPKQDYRPSQDDDEVTVLPAPRPVWEARPVTADAQVVDQQSFVVRPGDTLRRVGAATGAGSEAIARANGLQPPFTIDVGQQLSIPGGRYHLVRTGQSGIAIARAYGVPWARVVEANGLVDPFILRTGMRVLIPGTTAATPSRSAAQRAAAFTLNIDDILTGGEPALAVNQQPVRPVESSVRVLPTTAVVTAPARLSGSFIWPVQGRLISRFGPGQSGERQNGVTIAAPLGTPVRAAADGVVAYVGSGIQALGGLVIVRHGTNWTTVYGYAAKLLVQRGQAVKKGQTLALSGETGSTERPAVHFELRKGRTPVDPQTQLPPLG